MNGNFHFSSSLCSSRCIVMCDTAKVSGKCSVSGSAYGARAFTPGVYCNTSSIQASERARANFWSFRCRKPGLALLLRDKNGNTVYVYSGGKQSAQRPDAACDGFLMVSIILCDVYTIVVYVNMSFSLSSYRAPCLRTALTNDV